LVNLQYSIEISKPKELVWNTMLDPVSYKEWAKAFSPDSGYTGNWVEGSSILFTDPSMGGTKALLEKVVPLEHIRARHIAVIQLNGVEDTESEEALKWIGAIEEYRLSERDGVTTINVEMAVHSDFECMFNDCWPEALKILKALCEDNKV
jgi:hypothetical protein